MDSPSQVAELEASVEEKYRSRPGALIWFFRKSRNGWKAKYKKLKAELSRTNRRLAYANQVRDESHQRVAAFEQALKREVAKREELEAQLAVAEQKKKTS